MQAKPLRRSRPGAGGGTEEGQRREGGGGGRRRGRGRPACWEKGQREPGERQFRGPEGSRRLRQLRPRGKPPLPRRGCARPSSLLAVSSSPLPAPLPGRFPFPPPPRPPSSRLFPQPLGHSLMPLGARSGDGAIPGSRGSRAPGLPGSRLRPPESSKHPGSADCGPERAIRRRSPPGTAWRDLPHLLTPLQPLARPGPQPPLSSAVEWREPREGSDACAGL